MTTVRSALKLSDGMTGPLQGIFKSMNLVINAMQQMQSVLDENEQISKTVSAAKSALVSSEAEITKAIEDTIKAQEQLNEEISKQPAKPPEPPAPKLPPPPTWETISTPEIFQTSGIERYSQEIEALQAQMSQLATAQQALDMSYTEFLPPGAVDDINALQERLQRLGTQLERVEAQKDALGESADPAAFDALNASVEKIRMSIQQAAKEQDDMNKSMLSLDVSGVEKAYRNLNRIVDDTEVEIRNNIKEQERFNQSVEQGEKSAGGLLKKIAAFAGAYLGGRAIVGFFRNANGAASQQIAVEQRLQTIMSNINGMTQDGIELVKERARELEKTTAISAGVGIMGQSQLAEYVYDPRNISDMTEAMYNLATETYGANVSAEQLQQTANLMGKVMMGDINALSRNGFRIDAIFTEAEQQLLKTGTEAERAALVIQMIDENLSGLAEAMGNTPEGQAIKLANAWGSVQEKIGYGVMPLIQRFTDFLMSNMPTIEIVFMNVFGNIIKLLTNIAEIGVNAANWLIENWSWLGPILSGVAVALGGILIAIHGVTIATNLWKAAQAALNTIMKANPFILIISLIIALGVAIYNLWKKNDNFAAGLMRAWNGILNFFDRVPVFFKRVGNGIANAFDWAKVKSLELMEGLVNGVIDGINWLIEKLNNIPFIEMEAVGHVSFAAEEAVLAEARRQTREADLEGMEEVAALKAAEREQKVLDFLEERDAKRKKEQEELEKMYEPPPPDDRLPGGGWEEDDNTLINGGKLDEVGKIRDTVDISSEDLKTMRELAEMKNIQNFVTLTPQISMGDTHIRQDGRSIDEIVSNITERMEQELVASARGVYDV